MKSSPMTEGVIGEIYKSLSVKSHRYALLRVCNPKIITIKTERNGLQFISAVIIKKP